MFISIQFYFLLLFYSQLKIIKDQDKYKISFLVSPQIKNYTLDTNFQTFNRLLQQQYQITSVDDLSLTTTDEIIVIATCSQLQRSDIESLKEHIKRNGKLLLLLTQDYSKDLGKYLLEYGIELKHDIVINQTYQQGLYHPGLIRINSQQVQHAGLLNKFDNGENQPLDLVVSNAVTMSSRQVLNNQQLNTVIVTPDSAFPANQPLLLTNTNIVVCASADMFSDEIITHKTNIQLLNEIMKYLSDNPSKVNLNQQGKSQEQAEQATQYVVDTQKLAQNFKPILSDDQPEEITWQQIGKNQSDKGKQNILPQVVQLFKKLNLQQPTQLKIINPAFERPTPPLQPAVQQPGLPEPVGVPELPLYDLDNILASDDSRLARLANKYGQVTKDEPDKIEQFIKQCGEIFNIEGSAHEILYTVLTTAVNFKKAENQ